MSEAAPSRAQPVRSADRLITLDAMRGLAILGILAVNIVGFAFPFGAYMDHNAAPQLMTPAAEAWLWVSNTFFHSKFITLFTLLFGASIYMVGGERKDPVRAPLIPRRLLWLVVIALAHGLLLWWGDVLLLYAVTGLVVMTMRSMSARRLIVIGLSVTVLISLIGAAGAVAIHFAPPEVQASMEAQKAAMGGGPEAIAASIAAYRSGWAGMMSQNFAAWAQLQFASLLFYSIPTAALMMLGMGLLKSGFMAGRAPAWVYGMLIVIGGAVLAGTAWTGWRVMVAPEGPEAALGLDKAFAAFAFPVTLAYMSLVILLATRGAAWVVRPLAPVGRMAFTNYLTQSLFLTTVFVQPWGPRLIGQVPWETLPLIVAGVWALQLVWSPLWLSMFRMGPMEWVWRRLTYGPVPLGRDR